MFGVKNTYLFIAIFAVIMGWAFGRPVVCGYMCPLGSIRNGLADRKKDIQETLQHLCPRKT
jgi:polyferredoxin